MFSLSKKPTPVEQAAQLFPAWERVVKVGLSKELTQRIIGQGQPEQVAGIIAAQAVDYITAEDPHTGVDNAISRDPSSLPILEAHREEIIPAAQKLMNDDALCREMVVNYLRIKGVITASTMSTGWEASPIKTRINAILATYGPEFPHDPTITHFNDLVTSFGQVYFDSQNLETPA